MQIVLPAVMLTPRLLGAISKIRPERILHTQKTLRHSLYARRLPIFPHVTHQRKQTVPPEQNVGVQDLGDVREQFLRIDFLEQALRL